MTRIRNRAGVIAIAALCTGIVVTGTAYAYWTTTGTGSGSSESTSTVTLSLTLTAGSGLYPGATSNVSAQVNNTSTSGALTITSLVQNGNTTVQTVGKGTCTATVVTFTAGTLPPTSVAAGSNASVPGTVTMSTAALDGCQGTTFSI